MNTRFTVIELQIIYNFLNTDIFNQKLPDDVYINLSYKVKGDGVFLYDKWDNNKGKYFDEIIIDENLLNHNFEYFLAVLTHQMIHCWQHYYGNQRPPKHYHNKEFVKKAFEIGLIIELDKKHEIIDQSIDPDGLLKLVINNRQLLDKVSSLMKPRNAASQLDSMNTKKKVKYKCPKCDFKIYAHKTSKKILCIECNQIFIEYD